MIKAIKTAGLLLAPFAIIIALIHPFADVLYGGDDWSYAWSSWKLALTGELKVSDWTTATAIPQIVWGGLFLLIFGFKLSVLNLSTMIAAIFGILLYYKLLNELGFKENESVVIAVFTCATPLYTAFSISFMSDMPYCVSMIAASLFYVRAINSKGGVSAFIASIICAIAILNRQ